MPQLSQGLTLHFWFWGISLTMVCVQLTCFWHTNEQRARQSSQSFQHFGAIGTPVIFFPSILDKQRKWRRAWMALCFHFVEQKAPLNEQLDGCCWITAQSCTSEEKDPMVVIHTVIWGKHPFEHISSKRSSTTLHYGWSPNI